MKIQIFILLLAFKIVSCSTSQKTKSQKKSSAGDNRMNSLDWIGNYQGILPCADCEGIKTKTGDGQFTINKASAKKRFWQRQSSLNPELIQTVLNKTISI